MSKKVAVFRKEHFNAAHRLFNPDWDDAANESGIWQMRLAALSWS